MAIDLINYTKIEDYTAARESGGSMKTIENEIIRILQSHELKAFDSTKAVNRTGHARFRRGPSVSEPVKAVELNYNIKSEMKAKSFEECKGVNSANSSGSSSITGEAGEEGTVSNGKAVVGVGAAGIAPAPRTYSSGKPPLPTSHRKRCREIEVAKLTSKSSGSRGCHCCKRRYNLFNFMVIVSVVYSFIFRSIAYYCLLKLYQKNCD